jgi:8-oxo-dGTP diphosphatase
LTDLSNAEIEPAKVAIGLIRRDGSYLIRKRPPLPGSPMPGRWEFPGGKCEPGESIEDAVRRECREETGLTIRVLGLRQSLRHHYPHGFVELHYFDCTTFEPSDQPDPRSGFLWQVLDFPEANQTILQALACESSK